jgi:hypothetical protein
MSQPTPFPDLDSGAGHRSNRPQPPGEPPPLLYPEGLPLISIFVAAAVSFVFLVSAPFLLAPVFLAFMTEGESSGPLVLPIFTHNPLLEALVGTAVLTIISLTLVSLERIKRVPNRLPFVLSFPVAWALVLPSMLEHGGWWVAWLLFSSLLAGAFCLHWWAFQQARDAWD